MPLGSQILKNTTGFIHSTKIDYTAWYQSGPERSFVQLLELSPSIIDYCTQPITYHGKVTGSDKMRRYTPDAFYVTTQQDRVLVEIKNSPLERFSAEEGVVGELGKACAKENGWRFKVCCPPSDYADFERNVDILMGYRSIPPNQANLVLRVMETLRGIREASIYEVAKKVTSDDAAAGVVPVIYHLIARSALETDMHTPISTRSPVRMWTHDAFALHIRRWSELHT